MMPIGAGRRAPRAVAGLIVLSCLAACSSASVSDDVLDNLGERSQPNSTVAPAPAGPTTSTTLSPNEATCEDNDWRTASYRPVDPLPQPGDMPEGSYMREIQDRGHLIVGVDENTRARTVARSRASRSTWRGRSPRPSTPTSSSTGSPR
jgi:hypothetical protein